MQLDWKGVDWSWCTCTNANVQIWPVLKKKKKASNMLYSSNSLKGSLGPWNSDCRCLFPTRWIKHLSITDGELHLILKDVLYQGEYITSLFCAATTLTHSFSHYPYYPRFYHAPPFLTEDARRNSSAIVFWLL